MKICIALIPLDRPDLEELEKDLKGASFKTTEEAHRILNVNRNYSGVIIYDELDEFIDDFNYGAIKQKDYILTYLQIKN